jgi:hypothetical protein
VEGSGFVGAVRKAQILTENSIEISSITFQIKLKVIKMPKAVCVLAGDVKGTIFFNQKVSMSCTIQVDLH